MAGQVTLFDFWPKFKRLRKHSYDCICIWITNDTLRIAISCDVIFRWHLLTTGFIESFGHYVRLL